MAIFTVHAPPDADRSVATADRIRLVRDGFSWLALILPLPWLLWHRLWLATLGYLLVLLAIEGIARFADERAAVVVAVLFGIWFALEARAILRWTLSRRGWSLLAVVEGGDADVAERRFFHAWTGRAAGPTPPPIPANPARGYARPTPAHVIGLFPETRGR